MFSEFSPQFPVYQLRLVPAVLGSMVVPLVYQICVELRMSRWSALLAGVFVLLGKLKLMSRWSAYKQESSFKWIGKS